MVLLLVFNLDKSQQQEGDGLIFKVNSKRTNSFLQGRALTSGVGSSETHAAIDCLETWWNLQSLRDSEFDFGQWPVGYNVQSLFLSGGVDQVVCETHPSPN